MNNKTFISFLDVAACGMGASLLLFLIGVLLQDMNDSNHSANTLLVRCERVKGSPAPVGIEYFAPNASGWKLAEKDLTPEQGYAFGTSAEERSGLVSYMVLFAPKAGLWKFRPILLGVSPLEKGNDLQVKLYIHSQKARVNHSPISRLLKTGECGEVNEVIVHK